MMAWSILCSLIAVTRYSTLRILTASDRDSDNEREMNKHKKVNKMRQLNLFFTMQQMSKEHVLWACNYHFILSGHCP